MAGFSRKYFAQNRSQRLIRVLANNRSSDTILAISQAPRAQNWLGGCWTHRKHHNLMVYEASGPSLQPILQNIFQNYFSPGCGLTKALYGATVALTALKL
jgi:hypothetical protein